VPGKWTEGFRGDDAAFLMALATPKDVNTYMRGDVQRASGMCKDCLHG
jgi:hypothetical protein